MTHEFSYKLGKYKVTEVVGGGLCWESHHALGSIQKGKCLIEGNILILGPSEIEQPGFLKKEFMEHLEKLPSWDKTKYYCLSHSIHKCRTGGSISLENEMDDRVGAPINAVKVAINDSLCTKEIINQKADARKEFGYFQEKLAGICDFIKQWLSKSSR